MPTPTKPAEVDLLLDSIIRKERSSLPREEIVKLLALGIKRNFAKVEHLEKRLEAVEKVIGYRNTRKRRLIAPTGKFLTSEYANELRMKDSERQEGKKKGRKGTRATRTAPLYATGGRIIKGEKEVTKRVFGSVSGNFGAGLTGQEYYYLY